MKVQTVDGHASSITRQQVPHPLDSDLLIVELKEMATPSAGITVEKTEDFSCSEQELPSCSEQELPSCSEQELPNCSEQELPNCSEQELPAYHSHASVGEISVAMVTWLEHDVSEVHLVVLL